jgi:hypothetical protein
MQKFPKYKFPKTIEFFIIFYPFAFCFHIDIFLKYQTMKFIFLKKNEEHN